MDGYTYPENDTNPIDLNLSIQLVVGGTPGRPAGQPKANWRETRCFPTTPGKGPSRGRADPPRTTYYNYILYILSIYIYIYLYTIGPNTVIMKLIIGLYIIRLTPPNPMTPDVSDDLWLLVSTKWAFPDQCVGLLHIRCGRDR